MYYIKVLSWKVTTAIPKIVEDYPAMIKTEEKLYWISNQEDN